MADQGTEVPSIADIEIPQHPEMSILMNEVEGQLGNLHVQLLAERALNQKLTQLLVQAQEEIVALAGRRTAPLRTVDTPPPA